MIRPLLLALLFIPLAGCSKHQSRTLGSPEEGSSIAITAVRRTDMDSRVVLHGTMIEKCQIAGCWFILQDDTGTIKVDTKNAGFVVVNVPLNSALAVAGRVTTNGAERIIDATGLRY